MFLPLGDDNSRVSTTPFIVFILIAINGFFWFLQSTLGESFTYGYSAIPYELVHGVDLTTPERRTFDGQSITIPMAPGPTPIYLTLLTAMFMHGSTMHIVGNMLYLFIFGDQIEDRLGHLRFFIFYLFCGFAASAAHILVDPESTVPCLGASGAIAGVLGAYLLSHPKNLVRVLFIRQVTYIPAFIVLGAWFVIQIVGHVGTIGAQSSGVAYMAHIGGFIAGIPLFFLLSKRQRGRR